jgi:flagellar biosynthesis/type III secretory pathway protein FliH
MRESSTALAYFEEGRRKGIEEEFQVAFAKGFAEGFAKGFEEGQLLAARMFLLSFGTRRLGAPTEAICDQIEANRNFDELMGFINRIQDVKSWSELLEVN